MSLVELTQIKGNVFRTPEGRTVIAEQIGRPKLESITWPGRLNDARNELKRRLRDEPDTLGCIYHNPRQHKINGFVISGDSYVNDQQTTKRYTFAVDLFFIPD